MVNCQSQSQSSNSLVLVGGRRGGGGSTSAASISAFVVVEGGTGGGGSIMRQQLSFPVPGEKSSDRLRQQLYSVNKNEYRINTVDKMQKILDIYKKVYV